MRDGEAAGLQACLTPLTNLTRLEGSVFPIDAVVVRVFAACAARMPRLCAARMTWWEVARAGWYEGLRELPSWGRYEFELCV